MKKHLGLAAVLGVGLTVALATPAAADTAGTIYVPDDFVLSATGKTGHYEVQGTGLRIWTEGATSTDKVAEYVATDTALADIGEPALNYTATSGTTPPGFQLVVDLNDDSVADGILVGEPTYYGTNWWASNPLTAFITANPGATPAPGPANGYTYSGPLSAWRTAYPDATVLAFGFSLGSGVLGDGVISSIDFAGVRYTFAQHTVLAGKDECKNGGWTDSTKPVFKNQGDCVSSFATAKSKSKTLAK